MIYNKRLTILSISLVALSLSLPTRAQITPDETLGNENSNVNSTVIDGVPGERIEGGAIRGTNLFHSFDTFSINEGLGVYFANPAIIENIISRVTGNNPSQIMGTLGVLGDANLLFINPNGIIFGSNSSLNVNGSFIGSSANKVIFDGFEFTTNTPQAPPLLTINTPIGLGFNDNPGTIVNQSSTVTEEQQLIGLKVDPGQTLALVGGDVSIPGGFLTIRGGRIEVGSVAGNSRVGLIPKETGWELSYEGVESFQDINLSNLAFIANVGETDDIQIQGRNITITEGSAIFSENKGVGSGGGNLIVKASESVEILGAIRFGDDFIPSNLNIQATSGESGDLLIETKNLILRNGAQIFAGTFGNSNGGSSNIIASESIELIGTEETGQIPSSLSTQVAQGATGNGGNLEIDTNTLIIKNGAQITANTFATGNAGDVNIEANSIEINGTNPQETFSSGLFANVEIGATGNGGGIDIKTDSLVVKGGGQVSASTFSLGNAGDININAADFIQLTGTSSTLGTDRSSGIFVSTELGATGNVGELNITTNFLTVEQGGKISADNSGTGESSNATIDVNKLLVRDGGLVGAASLLGENSSSNELGDGGILTINADSVAVIGSKIIAGEEVNSSLFTRAEGTGNAGDLQIFTNSLAVIDGAEVNVMAEGAGAAGNLTIEANTITLDNGRLTANTAVGDKGNIEINSNNLFLRNGNGQALITTNAESSDGGNIKITTDNLVATDNSDITANAERGRGGQVTINAKGIFGIEAREQQTLESDITATSNLGVQFGGDIIVNTPEIEPDSGLNELPSIPIDAEALIAQNLCNLEDGQIAGGSSFVILGRGGLPPTTKDPLINQTRIVAWEVSDLANGGVEDLGNEPEEKLVVIQQAQGWAKTQDGKIVLTANAPMIFPKIGKIGYPECKNQDFN